MYTWIYLWPQITRDFSRNYGDEVNNFEKNWKIFYQKVSEEGKKKLYGDDNKKYLEILKDTSSNEGNNFSLYIYKTNKFENIFINN